MAKLTRSKEQVGPSLWSRDMGVTTPTEEDAIVRGSLLDFSHGRRLPINEVFIARLKQGACIL